MWALLDIRTGRANRMQFLALIGLCIALAFVSVPSGWKVCIQCCAPQCSFQHHLDVLPHIYIITVLYFFCLSLLRRLRDTGKNGNFFAVLIILYFYFFIIFLDVLDDSWLNRLLGSIVSVGLSFEFERPFAETFSRLLLFFLPLVSGFLFFFGFSLFKRGDPKPNEHGYPPRGLDFRTMTQTSYPSSLREQYHEQERRDGILAVLNTEERQRMLEKLYSELIEKSGTSFAETQEFKGRE